MKNRVDEVVFKIAKAFNRVFPDIKGFYVFGIHTDGKLHRNEDVEIVALFDVEDKAKREQIWPIIGKIETDMDICIDLYPYTQEQFEADEEVYSAAVDEGIFYNPMGIRD
jgi:predicted nucleotidyltransferase